MSWTKRAAELRERAAEVGSFALEHGGKLAAAAKEKAVVYGHVAGENIAYAAKETKDAAERAHEKWKKEREERERERELQEKPVFAGKIFGVTLQLAIERSRLSAEVDLPAVLIRCIQYVEDNGLTEEGLYRISASQSSVHRLKAEFDGGDDVDIPKMSELADPHTVAGCLKLYLRELPEPIIPQSLAKTLNAISPESATLKAQLISALSKLPRINLSVLSHLAIHLQKVSIQSEKNKMPASNLAIVFGVTLALDANLLAEIIELASDIVSNFVDSGALRHVLKPQSKHLSSTGFPPEAKDARDRDRRGLSEYEGLRKKKPPIPTKDRSVARRTVSGSGFSFAGSLAYSSLKDKEEDNPFLGASGDEIDNHRMVDEDVIETPNPTAPRPALPPRPNSSGLSTPSPTHVDPFSPEVDTSQTAVTNRGTVSGNYGNRVGLTQSQADVITSAAIAAGLNRGRMGGLREKTRAGSALATGSPDPFSDDGSHVGSVTGSVRAIDPVLLSDRDNGTESSNPFASGTASPALSRSGSNPFGSNESLPQECQNIAPASQRSVPGLVRSNAAARSSPGALSDPVTGVARRAASGGSVAAGLSKFNTEVVNPLNRAPTPKGAGHMSSLNSRTSQSIGGKVVNVQSGTGTSTSASDTWTRKEGGGGISSNPFLMMDAAAKAGSAKKVT
ncbi:RhoGAP-domain-containing protein [Gonapodya prolifera JEL478]|uniref:RhoGAP-domain-containing protein n=1 Tax=Gonapodya prolifera (strain JEL478) TaxID=1344416 RepID=A0A139AF20_GONPJ|nr:RhoGAP-domain-containing protein [Gonapodya prolifera JEL478]|eukprot:KXS15164.1 RhoGAP-domain-containing protein [Gonapodya prolifera JEL478]